MVLYPTAGQLSSAKRCTLVAYGTPAGPIHIRGYLLSVEIRENTVISLFEVLLQLEQMTVSGEELMVGEHHSAPDLAYRNACHKH